MHATYFPKSSLFYHLHKRMWSSSFFTWWSIFFHLLSSSLIKFKIKFTRFWLKIIFVQATNYTKSCLWDDLVKCIWFCFCFTPRWSIFFYLRRCVSCLIKIENKFTRSWIKINFSLLRVHLEVLTVFLMKVFSQKYVFKRIIYWVFLQKSL